MKAVPLIFAVLLAGGILYRRRRLSAVAQGVAALACLGLLAYGSGLIHPPQLEVMIRDGSRALGAYTYALVGAFAYLETGVGVGLLAPGELVVILGGVSAGQGEIALIPLIAIVWASALAGDLTSFLLGRRLGRGFLVRRGPAVGITIARLEQVERFFAAHGGKTIIVGRFVGLVRPLAPFIAGASRMPPRRFIPYTTVAAGLWATAFCLLGSAFWQSLDQLLAITKQGSFALAAVIVVAVGAVALYRRVTETAGPEAGRETGNYGHLNGQPTVGSSVPARALRLRRVAERRGDPDRQKGAARRNATRGRSSAPAGVNMLLGMVDSEPEPPEPEPQGRCVCGQRVSISDAREITLPNGRPGWEGYCPECGAPLFVIRRERRASR